MKPLFALTLVLLTTGCSSLPGVLGGNSVPEESTPAQRANRMGAMVAHGATFYDPGDQDGMEACVRFGSGKGARAFCDRKIDITLAWAEGYARERGKRR